MTTQQNDTTDHTNEIDEEYEASLGNQMDRLNETRKRLEGDYRLAEATAELQAALGALDDANMAIIDASNQGDGTTDEDAAAQALVADELAAVNRRLDLLLALAAVRDAARGLGRAVCRPEVRDDESDAVEN